MFRLNQIFTLIGDYKDLDLFEDKIDSITLIEWPEMIKEKPENLIELIFKYDDDHQKRSVQINADLLNPKIDNPITITSEIEEFINSNIKTIYPSIKYSVEGQIRSQAETGNSLKYSGPIVLILMLTIILLFYLFKIPETIFLTNQFFLLYIHQYLSFS